MAQCIIVCVSKRIFLKKKGKKKEEIKQKQKYLRMYLEKNNTVKFSLT